jgi:hypothetical protein
VAETLDPNVNRNLDPETPTMTPSICHDGGMTGGQDLDPPPPGRPLPPPGVPEPPAPPTTLSLHRDRLAAALEPTLPHSDPKPATPMMSHAKRSQASTAWYRSDQDRYKSVRRRANPWWRRLARGVVATSIFAALGAGLYFGARELQDYLGRDRLPSPGVDLEAYRATSFQIRSVAPAPVLDGTLTLDTVSHTFEFVGSGAGTQAGLQVVSPDGVAMYFRQDTGPWTLGTTDNGVIGDLSRALPFLTSVDTSDDILPKRLRDGYVELIDRATEGIGADKLTRYQMVFNTSGFSTDHPVQWQSYQNQAIPGLVVDTAVPVWMWTDENSMVVRLRDEKTGWTWERLTYADIPFALSPQIARDIAQVPPGG